MSGSVGAACPNASRLKRVSSSTWNRSWTLPPASSCSFIQGNRSPACGADFGSAPSEYDNELRR
jgi:hypothetical protein